MKPNVKSKIKWIAGGLLILVAALLILYKSLIVGLISYQPQNGDILFQSLQRCELIDAIETATHSPYSHCGVVLKKDGKWVVIQALGTVKYTPLYIWIAQGRFGKFSVYRLKPEYAGTIPKFTDELNKFVGLPYDYHYAMGDDAIYCSELAYKAYKNATGIELGRLVKLGNLDWQPIAAVIKKYEGTAPPLDLVMITPRNLSEAHQLVKVYSFGL